MFVSYRWPGNIRELANVVEYLCFTGKKVIFPENLPVTFIRSAERAENRRQPQGYEKEIQTEKNHFLEDEEKDEVFWFVLERLYEAGAKGQMVGREYLLKEAKERHLPISQHEIRRILERLSNLGLVRVTRGRGGSRITPEGWEMWERLGKKITI